MKKSLAIVVAMVALFMLALPMVSAQETTEAVATLTFTETEINQSFRVTNPYNRSLTNVHVDLQAANGGQVTISALYTWRSRTGVRSANVAAVVQPYIENGRLFWTVISITANGQPASADIVAQVNYYLMAAWRNYIAQHAPAGRLTDVTITDVDITFTYIPRL